MNTLYHIGDVFKVKGKPALAVIVEVSTTQEEYSVTYIDPMTHNECERDFGKNAWWTAEEIQKSFKEYRVFHKASTVEKENSSNNKKLDTAISCKTKKDSTTKTVISSTLSSVPQNKLLCTKNEIDF